MFYEITIWSDSDNTLRVHCEDLADFQEIVGWSDCEPGGIYSNPDGTNSFDVIIPKKYREKVVKFFRAKNRG